MAGLKAFFDTRELKQFEKNLKKLGSKRDDFLIHASRQRAETLISVVVPLTPVGHYRNWGPFALGAFNRRGGTLRRGWAVDTHEQAYKDAQSGNASVDPEKRARELPVKRVGNTYTVEVKNPVKYFIFVEEGHRTRSGGYVPGRHFLRTAEDRVKAIEPKIMSRLLKQFIKQNLR